MARGYSEEAIKEMRKAQKQSDTFKELVSMGLKFTSGLHKYEFPQFDYFYTLFDKYDQFGVLPYPGSHSEQPAIVIEIFQVLTSLKIEEQTRQQEKIRKKSG